MKKWAIPSLVPFWYHLVPHHQTLPNLVYKHLKPFWTTFRKGIFWLNEHRKTFISKSADFVIFSDITNKMADVSDILYISTALFLPLKLLVIYQANVFPILKWKSCWHLRITKFQNSKMTSILEIQVFFSSRQFVLKLHSNIILAGF